MSLLEISMLSSLLSVFDSNCGKNTCESSTVETDEKYLFKHSAFSLFV